CRTMKFELESFRQQGLKQDAELVTRQFAIPLGLGYDIELCCRPAGQTHFRHFVRLKVVGEPDQRGECDAGECRPGARERHAGSGQGLSLGRRWSWIRMRSNGGNLE